MRLVMVTPYYPPIMGGVTTYVLNLTNIIKSRYNIPATVITLEGENNINTIALNSPKWLFALKVFFIVCKIKPDVIHSHSWWYTLIPGVLYRLINHRTKVIHTLHTQPTGNEIKSMKGKIFETFLSACDTVTFVSKSQMKELENHLNIKTKKKVIYGAVSSRNTNEKAVLEIKSKLSLNGHQPVISFIGPLVHEKKAEGVKILIDSINLLKLRYPKILLMIIGDGEFRKNLENRAQELDIIDNVIFTGFRENIFDFLSLTDIYAHISLQESLGLSLIEAMSAGLPVIAANKGGIPEVIENGRNGILVEPEPEAIKKAIIELYEDKKRMKELGENARIDAERRFGLNRLADEFVQLYTNE